MPLGRKGVQTASLATADYHQPMDRAASIGLGPLSRG
jgi:hypothetical protein